MHSKDLLVDDGCNWKAIETVGKRFPEFDVVSPLAFIIESVDAVDRSTLVVPA